MTDRLLIHPFNTKAIPFFEIWKFPRQIHLEDRQSSKKSDEAKYREALEAARREVRGHFEASIEELKERHKLELQEGGTGNQIWTLDEVQMHKST